MGNDQRVVMVGDQGVIVQTPGAINDQRDFLPAFIADYIEAQAAEILKLEIVNEVLRNDLNSIMQSVAKIQTAMLEKT